MESARLPELTYSVLHDLERPPERRRLVHGFASPQIAKEVGELRRQGLVVEVASDWHGQKSHTELTRRARQLLVAHRMVGRPSTARKPAPSRPAPRPADEYQWALAWPDEPGSASGKKIARDYKALYKAIAKGSARVGDQFGKILVTSVGGSKVHWVARLPGQEITGWTSKSVGKIGRLAGRVTVISPRRHQLFRR